MDEPTTWSEEKLAKSDELKQKLIELAGKDPIFMQQLIEAMMVWFAFSAARQSELDACFILDSMAKHAKQFMLGPNLVAEGKRQNK